MTDRCAESVTGRGDFQTPIWFAGEVCSKINSFYSVAPKVLVEPTFGKGNILASALSAFPGIIHVFGVELDMGHFEYTNNRLHALNTNAKLDLFNANIFSFDLSDFAGNISPDDEVLIIGNPPWITSAALTRLGSLNLPQKLNLKGRNGIDALTGSANFDISEAIVFQLLGAFSGFKFTMAMLVKTSVAKNIVRDMDRLGLSRLSADLHIFNAEKVFGAACEAGLLVLKEGASGAGTCNVFDFDSGDHIRRFGWRNGAFFSNLDCYSHEIDGICPFEWRQGVKHDCAKVMEITSDEEGKMSNGLGAKVLLPVGTSVFPLLKGSDIRTYLARISHKFVIVTQRRIGENTSRLATEDADVWNYLLRYRKQLAARRSSVYKKDSEFSVFGVGPYAFASHKVGISGFYKKPVFSLISGDPPVMLDDTCYYLSFDNIMDAAISLALLNSQVCSDFLRSVAFQDSKRPFTKAVLRRIDLGRLAVILGQDYVRGFLREAVPSVKLLDSDFESYFRRISPAE
jgi:hypothetical protein